ncbi:MAG: hypothetical protein DWQ02_25460 [Bacteroidetes bacterium]|nr:MAG: hypothetical protein DWQ02_25460 [Bacteroidota bacterium]
MRKKTHILSLLAIFLPLLLSGQTIHLQLPQEEVQPDETIQLPISASGFDEVVSMQFSINWDPSVLTYVSHETADLPNIAIGDPEADEGKLRFSWFDVEGNGLSLADNSALAYINFLVIGNPGDFTTLSITSDPLIIQVFQATEIPGSFFPMELEQSEGLVSIVSPGSITFSSEPLSCFEANDGSIDLFIPTGTNYSFTWTGPDNFSASTQNIDELAAGTYNVTVTDGNDDIIYENTFDIIQPPAITVQNIETTQASCNQSIGTANILVSNGVNPLNFNIDLQQNNTGFFQELAAGEYSLTITDANNCTATDAFFIEASDAPQIDLGPDLEICEGESVILDAGQYLNYSWSDGSSLNSIEITQTGTYSVTVSNTPDCPGTDEVAINVIGLPQLFLENEDPSICPGDSVQLQVSGGEIYFWDGPNGFLSSSSIPDPIAFPDSSTVFEVMSENECGSDEIQVEVIVTEPMGYAGPDTCIILETEARLLAFGGEFYFWHPNEYPVSNDEIYDPVAFPLDSTTYFVTIIDENGCETTDSTTVLVASDPVSSIKAVNMITPNGDGKNDFLEFKGLQKFGSNTLKIYNRWGALIFQKVNYHHDEEVFDGTYNGKLLPSGNYYYILSMQSGEIKKKLTIVRE